MEEREFKPFCCCVDPIISPHNTKCHVCKKEITTRSSFFIITPWKKEDFYDDYTKDNPPKK